MAHTIYDNFYLSNEVEDQYNSHLDLQQFCTVDNSLVGTAGMLRKINRYKATNGTQKLGMGEAILSPSRFPTPRRSTVFCLLRTVSSIMTSRK